jgi:hypothetical protein
MLDDLVTLGPLHSSDGKSGAVLERVSSGDRQLIRKRVSAESDWVMRVSHDHSFRPLQMWQAGLFDQLPECIRHAIVDITLVDGELTLIMEDVGAWLVPAGDDPVTLEQHHCFIDHMATLHHRFLGFADDVALLPLSHRYVMFAPRMIAAELDRPDTHPVIGLMTQGWRLLDDVAPELAQTVRPLHQDATPLVAALRERPQTLLHGDWKMGNLGTDSDGRTILLDWACPGRGPLCSDLAHYLALNAARLPEPKEAVISAYRAALESRGVETDGWFDPQLGLCLIGYTLLMGWEKALAGGDELAWWQDRALAARPYLVSV